MVKLPNPVRYLVQCSTASGSDLKRDGDGKGWDGVRGWGRIPSGRLPGSKGHRGAYIERNEAGGF